MQYKTFINIEHAGLILKVELNSHFNFTCISFLFSNRIEKTTRGPLMNHVANRLTNHSANFLLLGVKSERFLSRFVGFMSISMDTECGRFLDGI